MSFRFTIEALGFKQLDRTLLGMTDAVEDWRPAFESVHDLLIDVEKRLFDTEGASGSQGLWNRYTDEPRYRAFKRHILGSEFPVLQWGRGGMRLMPSLTTKSHPEHVFTSTATTMEFGTSVPYADRLAQGGINPFGEHYPGRRAIDLNDRDRTEITRILIRHLREAEGRLNA
jgi:hypothetical protein